MSTDITPRAGENLDLEIRYAQVLADSDLVPQAYRGKPANILIAMGLGASMGLSRTESLYRIDVISGKPAAAAELIAANVRRAGHSIRTVVNEQETWAETTITRRDDPGNPITVRRDMDWAKRMGLATKDNYRKQPATMLAWRSISACARLACSEALYGVAHTADELTESLGGDDSRGDAPKAAASAATFAPVKNDPVPVQDRTPEQQARLAELFDLIGVTDADGQRAYIAAKLPDRDGRKRLTSTEADTVIRELEADVDGGPDTIDGEVVEDAATEDGADMWAQEDAEAGR